MAQNKPKSNTPSSNRNTNVMCFVDRMLGDVSRASAAKQTILGTSTGWLTGMLAIKAGKTAAIAAGSGIILIQLANQAGYIKINWTKVGEQCEKVSDKIEEKATGSGPNWMDKVERYVDKKMDKAEEKIVQNERRAKHWYSKLIGEDRSYKLEDIHIFLLSFAGGVALGVATS